MRQIGVLCQSHLHFLKRCLLRLPPYLFGRLFEKMREGVGNVGKIIYEPLVKTCKSDETAYIFDTLWAGPRLDGYDLVGVCTYSVPINQKAAKLNFSVREKALFELREKAFLA